MGSPQPIVVMTAYRLRQAQVLPRILAGTEEIECARLPIVATEDADAPLILR
jgi:hypothetical protein